MPRRGASPWSCCTPSGLTDLGWPPSSQLDTGGISTARGQEHFAFLFMGIAGGVGSHTFNIKVVTRPDVP